MKNRSLQNRYHLIDSLRGFAVLNMLAYHFCYDLFDVYAIDPNWIFVPWVHAWQRFICVSFILISGVSLNFSRNPFRRGLIVSLCGAAITAATAIAMPSQAIWYGIITFIGLSMLLTAALRPLLKRCSPFLGAPLSVLLFAFTYGVPRKFLGLFDLRLLALPDALYQFRPLAALGFPYPGFHSSDYFPVIPWIFLFFAGYFLWQAVLRLKAERFFRLRIPVLNVIGRYSIWIYMAHQLVFMGICWLIFGYI